MGMNTEIEQKIDSIVERCIKRRAKELDLSSHALDCNFGDAKVHYLMRHLDRLQHVKELYLNGWGIGIEGARVLAGAAARFPQLTVLELSGTGLGKSGLAEVGTLVAALPRLRDLRLNGNDLGGGLDAIEEFGCRVSRHHELSTLNLRDNAFDDRGLREFSIHVAPQFPSLKKLILNENSFGAHGVCCLAECSDHWPLLEEMDLSHNSLFSEGGLFLSAIEWPSLRVLDLSLTYTTSSGARSLAMGACRMPRLERLNVAACVIEDDGMRALIQALQHEPWLSSMREFVAHQNETRLIPEEVECSGDPATWRQYGENMPPTVFALKVASGAQGRGKRLTADAAKGILAILETCLAWPSDTVSERRLHASQLLKDKRCALGLEAQVSQTTVHNHLAYLAKACGLRSIVEVGNKRQSSRFRAGVQAKLYAVRIELLDRIRHDEERR